MLVAGSLSTSHRAENMPCKYTGSECSNREEPFFS